MNAKHILIPALLAASINASAKGGGEAPVSSAMENPIVITMIIIILILLLAIALLAHVVRGAMDIYRDKMNEEQKPVISNVVPVLILCFFTSTLTAQDSVAHASSPDIMVAGISNTAFYLMVSIIVLEMLIIFALLYALRVLLGMGKKAKLIEAAAVKEERKPLAEFWKKINRFKPVEQEADIDLGHDYDGIRELDNRLPAWWLYGFYLCIIVGIVYMWRYHVSHTAPSSLQEYEYAMQQGEEQKLAYLKNAANNIDENTVTYLGDESSLAAGKEAFVTMCAACHGKEGEGGVGPNLTDAYWLHGGSIHNIFKTIKYGWPDKGMRAWQDDYSPRQMAQIASYVKSLYGSKPANAKEKQGEFYKEEIPVADSTKLVLTK